MTKLDCAVVQDLLPTYIEGLTSPESNAQIEAHLADCAACREALAAMRAELPVQPPSVKLPKQLHFLRKVKRSRLWAAALTLVLMLVSLYALYGLEYRWHNDTHSIDAAIREYYAGFGETYNTTLLELRSQGGKLYAFYRMAGDDYGIMAFQRGFDGRYRITRSHRYTSSSPETLFITRDGAKGLYLIGGYHLEEIAYIGICLEDNNLDENSRQQALRDYSLGGGDTLTAAMAILPVEQGQFLYLLSEQELLSYVADADPTADYRLGSFYATSYRLYDAEMNDVTPEFHSGGGGGGSAGGEPWFMYGLVLFLCIVLIRYFLTD